MFTYKAENKAEDKDEVEYKKTINDCISNERHFKLIIKKYTDISCFNSLMPSGYSSGIHGSSFKNYQ